MDSTLQDIWKETMRKEQRFARKAADQAREKKERMMGKDAPSLTRSPQQKMHPSCQINFLDQTMGLVRNPHRPDVVRDKTDYDKELLLHGVSQQGEGKAAYLLEKKRGG